MVELTEKNLTMKPEEAVKWLGLGTETVRELLVKGVKWGEAVRMPSGRWRYIVYTAQLFNTLAVPYKVAIKKHLSNPPVQQVQINKMFYLDYSIRRL